MIGDQFANLFSDISWNDPIRRKPKNNPNLTSRLWWRRCCHRSSFQNNFCSGSSDSQSLLHARCFLLSHGTGWPWDSPSLRDILSGNLRRQPHRSVLITPITYVRKDNDYAPTFRTIHPSSAKHARDEAQVTSVIRYHLLFDFHQLGHELIRTIYTPTSYLPFSDKDILWIDHITVISS